MALQRLPARCVNRGTLRSPDVSEQPPVGAGRRVSQGLTGAIRPIAAAVICEADRILVWEDYDPSTGEVVAVPLAGGIEFGETGEQAIARELGEEIGAIPRRIRFLGLIEDIFEWAGKKRHELYLIYHVDLADQDAFEGEELTVTEPNGTSYVARWRPLSEFRGSARLVPEGLLELVERVRK
jgi:ADP-ribose pyrophosphatase YjhB (NUDIX family)